MPAMPPPTTITEPIMLLPSIVSALSMAWDTFVDWSPLTKVKFFTISKVGIEINSTIT
jgi:hypothetical protein